MIRNIILSVIFSFTVLYGPADAYANTPMDSQAIEANIIGKRIYLATPFGGEFPLYYQKDGSVDGSGQALGLGRFMRPTDRGRWWIDGDQLCQQWQTWYEGKRYCFTLQRTGEASVFWMRDDGLSGKARIGE